MTIFCSRAASPRQDTTNHNSAVFTSQSGRGQEGVSSIRFHSYIRQLDDFFLFVYQAAGRIVQLDASFSWTRLSARRMFLALALIIYHSGFRVQGIYRPWLGIQGICRSMVSSNRFMVSYLGHLLPVYSFVLPVHGFVFKLLVPRPPTGGCQNRSNGRFPPSLSVNFLCKLFCFANFDPRKSYS